MPDIDEDLSDEHLDLAQDIRSALRITVQMVRVLDYPGELSTAQVSVLNTLARDVAGSARIGNLARLGGVTQPGMSQLVSRLESMNLVERTSSDSDARVTLVQITEEGRRTLNRVNQDRNGVLASYLDRLGPADIERVRAGLGPLTRLAADIVSHQTTEPKDVSRESSRDTSRGVSGRGVSDEAHRDTPET